jgi:diadenosine tetraphosphate (Ap4A) HIT family hydrolase
VTDSPLAPKRPFDFSTYLARVQDGPCFVCAILEGNPDYPAIMVYEDNETVAFLARYPTLLGYCIVAPRRHVEHVIGDLEVDEYLRLQTVVHRVARAISAAVPTERIYLLSLGSQQGNAHVHWHIAHSRLASPTSSRARLSDRGSDWAVHGLHSSPSYQQASGSRDRAGGSRPNPARCRYTSCPTAAQMSTRPAPAV